MSPLVAPARDRRHPAAGQPNGSHWRKWTLAGVCLASILTAYGYAFLASHRSTPPPTTESDEVVAADPVALAALSLQPHLIFLHAPAGDDYRRVAVVPLDAPSGPRYVSSLQCQRVYVANHQGLCLGRNYIAGRASSYTAYTFGADFTPRHTFSLSGIASRVRIAPDGKLGATTTFVTGHSYADGAFSTQATLLDLANGAIVADLEQFQIFRDGVPFNTPDQNFWGVTFARDGQHFYATLGSRGKTYLVEGDIPRRHLEILQEDVECPSLSPDGTRLAFKKRDASRGGWQLSVLDLATMRETPVPGETRSVDDQAEWLDDGHLLYAMPDEGPPATLAQNIWLATLDGSSPPRLFVRQALSPAVARVTRPSD